MSKVNETKPLKDTKYFKTLTTEKEVLKRLKIIVTALSQTRGSLVLVSGVSVTSQEILKSSTYFQDLSKLTEYGTVKAADSSLIKLVKTAMPAGYIVNQLADITRLSGLDVRLKEGLVKVCEMSIDTLNKGVSLSEDYDFDTKVKCAFDAGFSGVDFAERSGLKKIDDFVNKKSPAFKDKSYRGYVQANTKSELKSTANAYFSKKTPLSVSSKQLALFSSDFTQGLDKAQWKESLRSSALGTSYITVAWHKLIHDIQHEAAKRNPRNKAYFDRIQGILVKSVRQSLLGKNYAKVEAAQKVLTLELNKLKVRMDESGYTSDASTSGIQQEFINYVIQKRDIERFKGLTGKSKLKVNEGFLRRFSLKYYGLYLPANYSDFDIEYFCRKRIVDRFGVFSQKDLLSWNARKFDNFLKRECLSSEGNSSDEDFTPSSDFISNIHKIFDVSFDNFLDNEEIDALNRLAPQLERVIAASVNALKELGDDISFETTKRRTQSYHDFGREFLEGNFDEFLENVTLFDLQKDFKNFSTSMKNLSAALDCMFNVITHDNEQTLDFLNKASHVIGSMEDPITLLLYAFCDRYNSAFPDMLAEEELKSLVSCFPEDKIGWIRAFPKEHKEPVTLMWDIYHSLYEEFVSHSIVARRTYTALNQARQIAKNMMREIESDRVEWVKHYSNIDEKKAELISKCETLEGTVDELLTVLADATPPTDRISIDGSFRKLSRLKNSVFQ